VAQRGGGRARRPISTPVIRPPAWAELQIDVLNFVDASRADLDHVAGGDVGMSDLADLLYGAAIAAAMAPIAQDHR
jgi:hypothetical protein